MLGRYYPVRTLYSDRDHDKDYGFEAVKRVFRTHTLSQVAGDILVFLTGQEVVHINYV